MTKMAIQALMTGNADQRWRSSSRACRQAASSCWRASRVARRWSRSAHHCAVRAGFGWLRRPPRRLGPHRIGLRSGTVRAPGGLPSGIFQLPLCPDLAAFIAQLRFGAAQGPFFTSQCPVCGFVGPARGLTRTFLGGGDEGQHRVFVGQLGVFKDPAGPFSAVVC